MPAGLGFIVQAILGMMGSQSLLHVGALSVRLSEGFLVLMAVCSVKSSCVLYLVVVSMVVLSQATLISKKVSDFAISFKELFHKFILWVEYESGLKLNFNKVLVSLLEIA